MQNIDKTYQNYFCSLPYLSKVILAIFELATSRRKNKLSIKHWWKFVIMEEMHSAD